MTPEQERAEARKAEIAAMPRKELNAHAFLLEREQEEYALEAVVRDNEIRRLRRQLGERDISEMEFLNLAQKEADKLASRASTYRKALEEIEAKASSYGLAAPLVKVCKNIAREALKGEESK